MRKFSFTVGAVATAMIFGAGLAKADAFDTLKNGDSVVYRHVAPDNKVTEGEIATIRLDTSKVEVEGEEEKTVDFKISVTLGGSSDKLEASGQCHLGEGQMDCRVSCDGSGFFLMAQDKNSILLMNPEGFSVNGCQKDVKKQQSIKSSAENSAYDLVMVTK